MRPSWAPGWPCLRRLAPTTMAVWATAGPQTQANGHCLGPTVCPDGHTPLSTGWLHASQGPNLIPFIPGRWGVLEGGFIQAILPQSDFIKTISEEDEEQTTHI